MKPLVLLVEMHRIAQFGFHVKIAESVEQLHHFSMALAATHRLQRFDSTEL